MNIVKKTTDFLKETKIELTKVSWPTKKELLGATMVVIVITSILALYIGIIDMFLSKLLSLVFK